MTKRNGVRATALFACVLGLLWAMTGGASAQATRDCADFDTQEAAQQFYDQHKNDDPNDPDPFDLDTDGDGKACEGLPSSGAGSTAAPQVGSPSPSPTATPAGSTTLTLSQSSVAPGGSLTASGSGFTASTTVTITMTPGSVNLGTATADTSGAFSRSVTIPSGTSAGSYTVTASGASATGTRTLTAQLTVTTGLGNTGAETGVIALSGLSLLEAGYGLTLASKRLGIRRRAVPLYLLRKFVRAADRGQAAVEVGDDMYLVHRSVLETAPLAHVPEVVEDVEPDAAPWIRDKPEMPLPDPEVPSAPTATTGAWPNVYAAIPRNDATK